MIDLFDSYFEMLDEVLPIDLKSKYRLYLMKNKKSMLIECIDEKECEKVYEKLENDDEVLIEKVENSEQDEYDGYGNEEEDFDESYLKITASSILLCSLVDVFRELKDEFWKYETFRIIYNEIMFEFRKVRKSNIFLNLKKNGYLNDELVAEAYYNLLRCHRSDYLDCDITLESLDMIVLGFTKEFRRLVKFETSSSLFKEIKTVQCSYEYEGLKKYLLTPKSNISNDSKKV